MWNGETVKYRGSLNFEQLVTRPASVSCALTCILFCAVAVSAIWIGTPPVSGIDRPGLTLLAAAALATLVWLKTRKHETTPPAADRMFALARRFNPVLDFHHPEVCQEMLAQQAAFAARRQASLLLLELRVASAAANSSVPEDRRFWAALAQRLKAESRQTDCLLRWSANSFLLVMPEVPEQELHKAATRLLLELNEWAGRRFDEDQQLALRARTAIFTAEASTASGTDILRETQRLLDEHPFSAQPQIRPQQLRMPI